MFRQLNKTPQIHISKMIMKNSRFSLTNMNQKYQVFNILNSLSIVLIELNAKQSELNSQKE
jgi:hypothetical protein